MPKPAASTKSWPRRVKVCRRSSSACGGAKEAFQILLLEHLDKLAEASAKAISNIKFDKVVVWDHGDKDGKGSTAGFLSSMANTLPPMLQVMKDIGGVELPESLVKLTGDGTDGLGQSRPRLTTHRASLAMTDRHRTVKTRREIGIARVTSQTRR